MSKVTTDTIQAKANLPVAALRVRVVPLAAHVPQDDDEHGHDEREGGRKGEVLDLRLARKLGALVCEERAENLKTTTTNLHITVKGAELWPGELKLVRQVGKLTTWAHPARHPLLCNRFRFSSVRFQSRKNSNAKYGKFTQPCSYYKLGLGIGLQRMVKVKPMNLKEAEHELTTA